MDVPCTHHSPPAAIAIDEDAFFEYLNWMRVVFCDEMEMNRVQGDNAGLVESRGSTRSA